MHIGAHEEGELLNLGPSNILRFLKEIGLIGLCKYRDSRDTIDVLGRNVS